MSRKTKGQLAKRDYLAQEHIRTLHAQLQEQVYADRKLANRYVQLIRRIGMKLRLRLPREIKKSYCKHCYVAFAPGDNCRVRLRRGLLVYYCFSCKKYTRTGYSRPKK